MVVSLRKRNFSILQVFFNTTRIPALRCTAGPKTIRINLATTEEAENIVTVTFETQEELKGFIVCQGAAGLRNGGDKLVSKLKLVRCVRIESNPGHWCPDSFRYCHCGYRCFLPQLVDGGLYTIDFASAGASMNAMKSDVKVVKLEQQSVNKALVANVGAKGTRSDGGTL
jgi:hypothetical protein